MKIAKIDKYNYEVGCVYAENNQISETLWVYFEDENDPDIYELYNDIDKCSLVYLSGKYYKKKELTLIRREKQPLQMDRIVVVTMDLVEVPNERL